MNDELRKIKQAQKACIGNHGFVKDSCMNKYWLLVKKEQNLKASIREEARKCVDKKKRT